MAIEAVCMQDAVSEWPTAARRRFRGGHHALSTHTLEHLDITPKPHCPFEVATATGDGRVPLTGSHAVARRVQEERSARRARPAVRLRRYLSGLADWLAAR